MENWIPKTIADFRYQVRSVVWRGSDHLMLNAWDTRLEVPRGLKVLRPENRRDQVSRARLVNEARLLTQIQHAQVLRAFDLVPDSELGAALVVAPIDALPLERMLRDEGRMVPVLALRLIKDVLAALVQIHGQGVLHGGLDGEAVLVRNDGRSVLAQLGRGRFGPTGAAQVQDDLRAVACLLFQMVAGHACGDLTHAALDPSLGVWSSLPSAIANVLRRAAHPSPTHQFSSALEMRVALDVAAHHTPHHPPPRRPHR